MMLLLDTHTFLWWCAADTQLSEVARDAIADGNNHVLVSAVSGWDIAIKARLGKLPLPQAPEVFMAAMLARHRFEVLPVAMAHALAEYDLPTHHSDPFDRLLIAQAKHEGLTLVSNDGQIARYDVARLW